MCKGLCLIAACSSEVVADRLRDNLDLFAIEYKLRLVLSGNRQGEKFHLSRLVRVIQGDVKAGAHGRDDFCLVSGWGEGDFKAVAFVTGQLENDTIDGDIATVAVGNLDLPAGIMN